MEGIDDSADEVYSYASDKESDDEDANGTYEETLMPTARVTRVTQKYASLTCYSTKFNGLQS